MSEEPFSLDIIWFRAGDWMTSLRGFKLENLFKYFFSTVTIELYSKKFRGVSSFLLSSFNVRNVSLNLSWEIAKILLVESFLLVITFFPILISEQGQLQTGPPYLIFCGLSRSHMIFLAKKLAIWLIWWKKKQKQFFEFEIGVFDNRNFLK